MSEKRNIGADILLRRTGEKQLYRAFGADIIFIFTGGAAMKNKKGFTLVELVIVIAVIAILAGVMIGTFASVVRKAHASNDVQLVRNLNTALRADLKEHKTMQEALDAAADFDYDVSIITASASGNAILWDSVNDYFCYFDKDNGISYYPEIEFKDGKAPEDYQLWKIYSGKEKVPAEQTYSVYWNKTGTDGLPETLNVGFDAGKNEETIELTYKRDKDEAEQSAQSVTIRTNREAKLTVDAKTDTVYHYGTARYVDVKAVAYQSYHVYGSVEFVKVSDGRAVVEAAGKVGTVLAAADNATIATNKTGTVEKAYAACGVTDSGKGNVTFGKIPESADATQLNVTSSNCEYELTDTTIKLKKPTDNTTLLPYVLVSNTDITFDLSWVGGASVKYPIIAKCSDGVIIYGVDRCLYWIGWNCDCINITTYKNGEKGAKIVEAPGDNCFRTQLIDNKIVITGKTTIEYTLENLENEFQSKGKVPTELVLGVTCWGINDGNNYYNKPINYVVSSGRGATVNCLGDSITDATNGWGHYTAALSAMGYTVNNYGKGGTTISNATTTNPFYTRIDGMSEDCDFIFMLGGTNDWHYGAVLGNKENINDENADYNTFCGGLYLTLQALRKKFPDKPIYVSTIMQRTANSSGGNNVTNKNGNTIEEFNDAIIYMAQKFDCIVLDGYNCITKANADTDLADGLHLSAAGAAKYAAFLDGAFQSTKPMWQ